MYIRLSFKHCTSSLIIIILLKCIHFAITAYYASLFPAIDRDIRGWQLHEVDNFLMVIRNWDSYQVSAQPIFVRSVYQRNLSLHWMLHITKNSMRLLGWIKLIFHLNGAGGKAGTWSDADINGLHIAFLKPQERQNVLHLRLNLDKNISACLSEILLCSERKERTGP